MSANFNYYLNRQGLRGRKGEKGDPGESVTVEVGQNTANTFTLLITTQDGTFETPNLRGSLINTTGAGTYLRYDRDTDSIYVASIDEATNERTGIVRLATDEEASAGEGDGVVTASQLGEGITANIIIDGLNGVTVDDATTIGNYKGFTASETQLVADKALGADAYVFESNHTYQLNAINDAILGVNTENTGFDKGNFYIEYPVESGKICGCTNITNKYMHCIMIFGSKYSDVFYPSIVVTADGWGDMNVSTVAGYADTSITTGSGSTVQPSTYFLAENDTPTFTLVCGLKASNGHVMVDGYACGGWGWVDGVRRFATYSSVDTGILTSEHSIDDINCCRVYLINYDDPNNLAITGQGFILGEFKSAPAVQTQAGFNSTLAAVGFCPILPKAANFVISVNIDNETIKINEQGKLYADVGVTVDDALSTASENPVQNKVITTRVNSIASDVSSLQTSVGNLQNTIDGGEV